MRFVELFQPAHVPQPEGNSVFCVGERTSESQPKVENGRSQTENGQLRMGNGRSQTGIWRLRSSLLVLFFLLPLVLTQSGCRLWNRTEISSAETLESRQYLQQSVDLLEDGETDEATRALVLAIKTNPDNYEARAMYAELLWKAGNQENAIIQMQLATRHADATAEMHVSLAQMLYETGEYASAQKALTAGLHRDATLAQAWTLQGKLFVQQHQQEQALAAFHQALFYEPENLEATIHLADSYLQTGKPQRALEIAQYARNQSSATSEENADSAALLYREGLALTQLRRYTDATNVLTLAADQSSKTQSKAVPTLQSADRVLILSALAEAQLQSGQSAAALSTAQQVLALAPSNAQCLSIAAQVQNPTLAPSPQSAIIAPATPQYGSHAGTLAP